MRDISSYIDHTLLKPVCSFNEIERTCEEALHYKFAAVCIPPIAVRQAKQSTNGSMVKVATVIGFPFGYEVVKAKQTETEQAIIDGADELDIVINLIALKSGSWSYLENEMKALIDLAHVHHKLVKVIIESGLLTDSEIVHCCQLYSELGADFLKTSTGYAEKGASIEAVRLMHDNLPPSVRIKASGGIRTYDFACQLIEAGASRLGCSASVAIVKNAMEEQKHDY